MKTLLPTLLIALLLSIDSTVFAASEGISKQQAVDVAMQTHPGRVLSVKRKAGVFLVKTLSAHGKVHIVKVDAKTGALRSGRSTGKHSGR